MHTVPCRLFSIQIPVDFTHILMGILPALGPDASDVILNNMVKYITPIRIDFNN